MKVARRDGSRGDRARRRAAGAISASPRSIRCSASAAEVWGAWNLALILTGMGSDGTRGARRHRRRRRQRDRAGRGDERGLGHAGLGGGGRRLLGGAAARSDRADGRAAVPGGAPMTPHDYDYLRKLLKTRSGLVLSADKHYLVESRLLPVARKAGLRSTSPASCQARADAERAHRRGGRGDDDERVVFLPRQDSVRSFPRYRSCRR